MANFKSSQLFKLCFKWMKFAQFSHPLSIHKDFLHVRCEAQSEQETGLLSPNETESDKDSEVANNGKAWTIRGSHCLCCAVQPKHTSVCLHLLKAAPLPLFAGYCRPLLPLANSILKCLSTQTVQKCHNYMLCVLIMAGATYNNTFQKYRSTFTFPRPGLCPCCAFLEASVVRRNLTQKGLNYQTTDWKNSHFF